MPKDKKSNSLDDLAANLNKKYGDGAITFMGDRDEGDRVSSGNIRLDGILDGGWPTATLCELFGPSGAGKSSLAMLALGQAQKLGFPCALIDLEGGMSQAIALACGVDINSLWYSQPGTAEDVFQILEDMIKSAQFGIIVVDSVAAMVTQAELAGDYSDQHVATKARLMSKGLPKLLGVMRDSKSPTIVAFINQVRDTINSTPYGPKEVTTGGKALGFYSSFRLEVKKGPQIPGKVGEDPIGHTVKVKVIKNRTAPPLRTAELKLYYDRGISNAASVIELAEEAGLMTKSGSWYTYVRTGEKLGNGLLASIDTLDNDPALTTAIIEDIRVTTAAA